FRAVAQPSGTSEAAPRLLHEGLPLAAQDGGRDHVAALVASPTDREQRPASRPASIAVSSVGCMARGTPGLAELLGALNSLGGTRAFDERERRWGREYDNRPASKPRSPS